MFVFSTSLSFSWRKILGLSIISFLASITMTGIQLHSTEFYLKLIKLHARMDYKEEASEKEKAGKHGHFKNLSLFSLLFYTVS